ncbi:MAG: FG-GAP-like repeat-containing protein, partial [Proteobacteria bacterium]|nr:FG-GAP-like repeat-containing protein [Pseudomonadota bacterium]
ANDPTWKKIAYTSVNWANDNKKGMAFGIILAALLSCWLSYFQFNPGGRWTSAVYGMILGTPLGVCVNCAAPVFKGALRSRRIEMALALMFASPTLNVVVLTMAFSLLPFYMALTKLVFNLTVILILVPLLARWLADAPVKDLQILEKKLATATPGVAIQESFGQSVLGVLKDFWKQLSSIFIRTAPLMLVAGFIGATLSHLVPLDALLGQAGLWPLLLAATIGLVLPVPMAFDVVLTNALFSAGLPQNVSLVLLLSLGIYSFYSFMITWQSASRRWAFVIAAALWAIIVPIGIIAPWLHESFYLSPNIAAYRQLTEHSSQAPASNEHEAAQLSAKTLGAGLTLPASSQSKLGDAHLNRVPFLPKQGQSGKFVQHEGAELGLDQGFMYTILDYPDPFWIGRGTAAGDFDNDGWVDIVFGSDHGPLLYRNVGGRFEAVPLNLAPLKDARVFSVALVDLDSDGYLDLFVSTFHRGNYWVRNLKGHFADEVQSIPNGDAVLTVSPAFADLNGDGRIDIYNGNMALGIATGFRAYGKTRQNGISWNRPEGFVFEPLTDEDDGETMASIISDINGDGHLDLYENNDFIIPDYLYFGGANGKLNRLKSPGTQNFASPFFSMSVDTADINND